MAIREAIQTQIQVLVDAIDIGIGSTRGHVFVDYNNAINVSFGRRRGSLTDAYKILEKLEEGGLLDGEWADGASLDNAAHTLHTDNPFKIGNNAEVFINRDGVFALRLTPTKSDAEILAGIKVATASLRAEQGQKALETARYDLRIVQEEVLERAALTVFTSPRDIQRVSDYLTQQVIETFPGSNATVEYQLPGEHADHPRFLVTVAPPSAGVSLESFSEFTDRALTNVFKGTDAVVFLSSGSSGDNTMLFSVSGNPARLLGDIKRNDPDKLPQQKDGVGRA